MGTALRLHFEEGTKQSTGKEALVCLCRHASKLNRISRKLELTPIGDFLDGTGTAPDAFPAGVTETIKMVFKTKRWFALADGLASLAPLLHWLEQHPTRFGLLSDDYRGVVEELRLCVQDLEARGGETCRFNLGIESWSKVA